MAEHKDRSSGSKGGYEVGRGRPPKHTQFKPGQSGNPKGRPKKQPTLAELVAKEGQKKIRVTEGGKEKQVTKFQAMVMAIFAKALKGEHKAWELLERFFGQLSDTGTSPEGDLAQEDAEILQRLFARFKGEDPGYA